MSYLTHVHFFVIFLVVHKYLVIFSYKLMKSKKGLLYDDVTFEYSHWVICDKDLHYHITGIT